MVNKPLIFDNKETCPKCGGDINIDVPNDLRQMIKKHKLISEYCNPGGRELIFEVGGRIQLSDMCNNCDHEKLREFFGECINNKPLIRTSRIA